MIIFYSDITQFAKEIASQYPSDLNQEGGKKKKRIINKIEKKTYRYIYIYSFLHTIFLGERYGSVAHRKLIIPFYTSEGKINIPRLSTIIFDKDQELNLSAVTSLVERGQTQWIASAIRYLSKDGSTKRRVLKDVLNHLDQLLQSEPTVTTKTTSSSIQMLISPMDFTDPGYIHGENVRPTLFQLAQAINRVRGIRIIQ